VDGATTGLPSPTTIISTSTSSNLSNYTTLSWSLDGLWPTSQTLGPGNHTIGLYVQNCGLPIILGRFSAATLTGMVLNK
jgi:hypothetical protein